MFGSQDGEITGKKRLIIGSIIYLILYSKIKSFKISVQSIYDIYG